MIIAVDFDGTITKENIYPDIGELREGAIETLLALQDLGNTVCLWTCRNGRPLAEALIALEQLGFKPDYVNCGPYTTGSAKMVADVYIDDAAWPNVGMSLEKRVDWKQIKEFLVDKR